MGALLGTKLKGKIKLPKSVSNFLILVVVAFLIKTTILEIYVVPTGSMLDTIEEKDVIIGNKFIYGLRTPNWLGIPFTRWGSYTPSTRLPAFKEVKNGDIVIFEFPNDDYVKYVKRCIGLPGQFVKIENGEISIGESEKDLSYREDLTYPPKSRFKKEKDATSENFTEKTSLVSILSSQIQKIYPYYKPIQTELNGNSLEILNADNMFLEVPYKGMEIDLGRQEVDLYSSLMLLLLDGHKIELASDKKTSEDNAPSSILKSSIAALIDSSKKYEFHKYDYQSMASTSVTINDFFTNAAKSSFGILVLIGTILYTVFVVFDSRKKYSNKKKVYQSIFCLVVSILIISFSSRETGNYNVQDSVNEKIDRDLADAKIPLNWFFEESKKEFIKQIEVEDLNYLEIMPAIYEESLENILDELSSKCSIKGQSKSDGSAISLQGLDVLSFLYSIEINSRKAEVDPKMYVAQTYQGQSECIERYFNDSDFKREINTIAYNYYSIFSTVEYKRTIEFNKNIKQYLVDRILIDGKSIKEQSKFTLNHNYYFMVGDNHNNSTDSRYWGFVPDYNLLGQPVITILNFADFPWLKFKFDTHL